VIGKKKRSSDNIDELTANKDRKMMGRKGIGKLAPFGIAKSLSLITICKETSRCYWLNIDISGLLDKAVDLEHQEFSYKPTVVCDGWTLEELRNDKDGILEKKDSSGYVRKFLGRIDDSGTLVVMDNLSLKRSISKKNLSESMGRRFTVTLLQDDFCVHINDEEVTEEQALPKFAYRIPEEAGWEHEIIQIGNESKKVRYWVGFVEQAEWPQDQAGVGVYAHGKIAQDRPFVFGLKGREISTRYMYGVIEADWLDELDEDVVSTDRTSINWENDSTEPMYKWGRDTVARWVNEYRKHQKVVQEEKVLGKFAALPNLPKVTSQEKNAIKDMVCSMSPKIYRDEELQNEVLAKLTSAWTHRPTRSIIKSLWDRLEKSEGNENEFITTLRDIHKHLVPESLSLSVTVAQRIYALTQLNKLSVNGTENQLQALLESFPWILGADKGKVSANQHLKTLAKEATLEGLIPGHGYNAEQLKELANTPDATTRPDFCFFSDENKGVILVVELKSPLVPLLYDHLMQLFSYYFWLKKTFPSAKVKGYLIGQNTGNAIQSDDPNIDIITWDNICTRSRKDYLELLAAMLQGIPEHYDDARIQDVFEFGGEPTRALLKRMADANSPLNDFFESIDQKLEKK
jgi:hypothetical protein